MRKLKHLHEPWEWFSIVIELPDGSSLTVKEKGRTHWEAEDRAHTLHNRIQKDRSKYMYSTKL